MGMGLDFRADFRAWEWLRRASNRLGSQFRSGQSVPNLTVVAVGTEAQFNVYNAAGFADVILDEDGFYGPVVFGPSGAHGPFSTRFDRQSATDGAPETLGIREGNWQRHLSSSKPVACPGLPHDHCRAKPILPVKKGPEVDR